MHAYANGVGPEQVETGAIALPFVLRITPHRARLLTMIVELRTNAEIAAALGVSPHTVKREIEVLRELTGCHSKRALARWWSERRSRYEASEPDGRC